MSAPLLPPNLQRKTARLEGEAFLAMQALTEKLDAGQQLSKNEIYKALEPCEALEAWYGVLAGPGPIPWQE